MPDSYRVGVIGHTGRGDYGHGLDTLWKEVPSTQVVAAADGDPKGLEGAVKRLGLDPAKGYADYRQMLEREKPDIVAICPRHLDQHLEMVLASAAAGAKGIYIEKPLARTLQEADEMVQACQKQNVKLAIAFQTRYSPRLQAVRALLSNKAIGKVLEFRLRGKEDQRGGGEDLWVLGTHVLNLTHHLGGEPLWCLARVLEKGAPVAKANVRPGPEGIGPLAGDELHAMYGLAGGATAYFDSVRGAGGNPSRFGLTIAGTAGIIHMQTGYLPPVHLLQDPSWMGSGPDKSWVEVTSAGPGRPEPLADGGLGAGNVAAVRDLIGAIETDRQPEASIYEARTVIEMIAGVFESHRTGAKVDFPLKNRGNPLQMLE